MFAEGHGFNYGQTGLVFVSSPWLPSRPRLLTFLNIQCGILIGIAIITVTACPLQEMYYQRQVLLNGGSTVAETRLPLMMGSSILLPISLFIFAWTSNPNTSWVGPAVAGIPFGVSASAERPRGGGPS